MGTAQSAITARGVTRRFGQKTALAGVDLIVAAGQVHALLGPNGAGKTTLTRILCGIVDVDEGTVSTIGRVGLVPSGDRSFYLRISGLENLVFFGRLHGLRRRAAQNRARTLLEQVGLSEAAKLPVGRYSHGMQKRLSVARALLAEPTILLVDEATHDLDPEGASRIRSLVAELASHGTAVLWTTQRIEEIRDFADCVTFLYRGAVRFTGSVHELVARAPAPRYVLDIRNGNPLRPPDAHTLQRALGAEAQISLGPAGPGSYVLAPSVSRSLGTAITALAAKGFEVTACRQERAEIEEAFLSLAGEEGS